MNQQHPVPRLDLAPKLKRPLSLWNPLDYLRLLYWVFYFPQALRWYEERFGGGRYVAEGEMNWRKGWQLLSQNAIRQLLFQGVLLTIVTLSILGLILQQLHNSTYWFFLASFLGLGVAFFLGLGVASGVAVGVAWGVALNVAVGVASGMVVFFLVWKQLELLSVPFFLGLGAAVGVAIIRPENWLIGLPFNLRFVQNGSYLLPRITPLPLPNLAWHLEKWLQQDWETGLHNVNQLLAYTLQFIPAVQAVNRVLAITPSEQLIWYVSRLAEAPFDWRLIGFASASLVKQINSQLVRGFLFFRYFNEPFSPPLRVPLRLDTPARAAAAGFWYLHEEEPAKALEAFAVVRSLLYGEEMFTLAQTLAALKEAKEPDSIAAVQIPPFPQEPLLRPTTWETLTSLKAVVENVQVVLHSSSRYQRSSSLNRALGEITEVIDNRHVLPQAECGLIVEIAHTWKQALGKIAKAVGQICIIKPVINPYVAGNPVEGNLFVGREDVMIRLQELWVRGHQLQSVVIYGHRRMGKTSILRNAANFVSADVQIAYVNLLEVGDAPEGVGEVMMAICDAISDAVQIPPPSNDDLLSLPLPTFRRYLEQVEKKLGEKGLIIALDEFEQIDKLIEAKKIPVDFMKYLRGLAHKSSKIAFALAGLHTLEEMTSDYFQPFYASVITIRVGFMEADATQEILANPAIDDFPLDYTPEALDRIYDLTHGQPYLVQLVGFQLVSRYNNQVFTMRNQRNPVFTVEDVDAVIEDADFLQKGSGYFHGVWGQAVCGAVGQHDILKILAPHPQGVTLDALVQSTNMDEATLQEALKTLTHHDVVKEIDGCWRIIVELFRLWVLQ